MNGFRRASETALAAGWLAAAIACAPVYSESARPEGGSVAERETPLVADGDPLRRDEPAATSALVHAIESFVWPLASDGSALLSSRYGERTQPRSGDWRFHSGLDLRAREGTPVYAAAAGVVSMSAPSGAYGNAVILDHAGGLQTVYAHHERNLVRVGDRIRRGQPIALVGHTGNATGDHLHFEVRWKGGTVDPRTVLPLLSTAAAAR